MSVDANNEELVKSLHRSGLVQVQRTVNSKHGQYQRMQWVRPSDVKESDRVVGGNKDKKPDKSYWVNASEGSSVVLKEFKRKYGVATDNAGKDIEFKFLPLNDTTQSHSMEEVVKHYNKSENSYPRRTLRQLDKCNKLECVNYNLCQSK